MSDAAGSGLNPNRPGYQSKPARGYSPLRIGGTVTRGVLMHRAFFCARAKAATNMGNLVVSSSERSKRLTPTPKVCSALGSR